MLLSVIAPAYNEQDVILKFHETLMNVLISLDLQYEVLYVNDGSRDNTFNILKDIQSSNPNVSIIDLSRNFGKEIALTAGLDFASGDAVVVIDTDLQDPPELIPDLICKMNEGYDVVYAKRTTREGESGFKKATSFLFYRFINKLSYIKIPSDTGDFRILSRRALDELNKLREHHRFMKGLFTWIGYPQTEIIYKRNQRVAGETKWHYWNLWNFALDGITSFSTKPLKISSYLGVSVAFISFCYVIYVIAQKLIFGNPVPGYPSLMVVILFLGGIQLMVLGVIGEYLARTFSEVKGRPLYIVKEYTKAVALREKNNEVKQ